MKMKNLALSAVVSLFFLTACVGGNLTQRDNQNMATNAAIGCALVGGTSAAIASVFGKGNAVGKAAVAGCAGGAWMWGANTPRENGRQQSQYQSGYPSPYAYGSVYERERYRRIEQLRQKEQREWEKSEKQRAWNDAEKDFYGK